jgi:vacuolar protein sorting-associated protein 41
VTFFCCHAYHEVCLQAGLDNIKESSNSDSSSESDEDEGEAQLGEQRMRCVLCTTAAG